MTDPARRLAVDLRRRGLGVPARLLAEAHRPIAPLLADLGTAAGPLLGVFAGPRSASFVADPRSLDRLLEELDATEAGSPTEEPQ